MLSVVKKFHQFLYGRHFKIYTRPQATSGIIHPRKGYLNHGIKPNAEMGFDNVSLQV